MGFNALEKALLKASLTPSYSTGNTVYCHVRFRVALTDEEKESSPLDPKSEGNRVVAAVKAAAIHVLKDASIENAHARSEIGKAEFSRYMKVTCKGEETPRDAMRRLERTLIQLRLRPAAVRLVDKSLTPWKGEGDE